MIPGYAKTFSNQRYDFMKRLKEVYADTLSFKVAFITYAWANEWRPVKYHQAKKSATAGAFDYYLFHFLLESFLHDTAYWEEYLLTPRRLKEENSGKLQSRRCT